jgi:hypothetical protein
MLGVELDCVPIDLGFERVGLVLVDGFSTNLAKILNLEDRNIQTCFPSSTAPALATLFTASPPCVHGIVGERVWVKHLGGMVNTLRYSFAPVRTLDELEDVKKERNLFISLRPIISEAKRGVRVVLPSWLSESQFSSALYGGADVLSCYNVWDCLEYFRISIGKGVLTFLYLNEVDTLSHKYGPLSRPTLEAASHIVENLRHISSQSSVPVLLTADHGFVEVERVNFLDQDTELKEVLELPPFGEPRALFLRSRVDLKTMLYHKYPDLQLHDRTESEEMGLLGQCSSYSSLGFDYIGIPNGPVSYRYRLSEGDNTLFKGEHGGLTDEELNVPLVTLRG